MTPDRFAYTFCNTMTRAESDAAFDRYVVPESRNVPRSTLTAQARIDFRSAHVPLLMIAGDRDHLTPSSMIRRNVAAYPSSSSPVEFREFADRSHFICNQAGWQDVADVALEWVVGR
jgi:pimeloyl-ACP methyl ester carboxylesterase